jgi:FkbM family methyltransferase
MCQTSYLGEGSALCRILGRYKIFADTRDLGLSPHLMLDGYWEMWLTEALVEVIKPGMTVVDVGANLGYFTLLMADLVGPGGFVHAFEPNPPIAHRLAKSIELNGFRGRVALHPEPLGSVDGEEVVLVAPVDDPKNAHVIAGAGPGLVLKTRRLDGYAELFDADVFKIDAEGAELDIWHGMSGLFEKSGRARERSRTIFLEFAPGRFADPATFLDEIEASGFEVAELTFSEGMRLRTREQILSAPPGDLQILVLRR